MASDFSQNLRYLCADIGSAAQVCRDIGLNRQQFNRYLNDSGLPAAHTLRRICRYFGLPEETLFMPHAQFRQQRDLARPRQPDSGAMHHLGGLFADQARGLRPYLGFYNGYFRTPTWPGAILKTLIWLRAENGLVITHTFERAASADGSIRQRGRYAGLAAWRDGRIYMYETARRRDGFLSETVLAPLHRQQTSYFQGLTLGVAARPSLLPFSTRTVWVRLSSRVSPREALQQTGAYPENSPRIDPKARRLLGRDAPLGIDPDQPD